MNPEEIIVFEDAHWKQLLPLVYVRGVFQLICGAGTLLDQIRRLANQGSGSSVSLAVPLGIWCRAALRDVVAEEIVEGVNLPSTTSTLFLNGRGRWHQIPQFDDMDQNWVGITGPEHQIACIHANAALAATLTPDLLLDETRCGHLLTSLPSRDISEHVTLFKGPWEIVLANEQALVDDWEADFRHHRQMLGSVADGAHLLNPAEIHIGTGTRIKPCVVIDAEDGPIWIGENVTIFPNSYVQGPALIGDGCLLQPGAVVHAGSTIGPRCKIGGEIEASIIQGYSNKQHDGFLGHSYLGNWVNIAADCINSDLKNTYGNVRVPINGYDVDTGEMFVGMIAGDHSKAGINVSFPTGSVIGFGSSVFAARSPKFVPSFAWVDDSSIERYDPEKAFALAQRVMARRQKSMTQAEQHLFLEVCQQAQKWESQEPFVLSRFAVASDSSTD